MTPMARRDENWPILALGALWLASRVSETAEAVAKTGREFVEEGEQQGVRLYEWLHDDEGHRKDLPPNAPQRARLRHGQSQRALPVQRKAHRNAKGKRVTHAPDSKPLSKSALIDLAKWAGFPDPNLAAAIALAESNGYEDSLGDWKDGEPTSFGLWQIHLPAHPQYSRHDMLIAPDNALAAYQISRKGTRWLPWSTFKTGKYKEFL